MRMKKIDVSHYPLRRNNCLIYKSWIFNLYGRKRNHIRKNERSLPDHEEQELWFSALVADDSCAYNVDKAFDRFCFSYPAKNAVRFSIFRKIVYGAAAVILLLIASTISFGKRAQFSGEPPYSSVLLFHTGDIN